MAETKAPAATSSSGVSGTKAAAAAGAAAAHQEPQPQHTNYLLVASYATIFALWGFSQVVYIPYVLHLLTLVTAILYCACHSSLILRKEDAPPAAAANDSSEHGSETTSRSTERETLRAEDAYQFPLVGSVSLFSLYLAFKFLDESLVNFMIGAYFAVVGCIALTMTLAGPVSRVTPVAFQRNFSYEYKIKHGLPEWIAGESPWELSLEFNGAELLSFIGAATICAFYFQSKRWFLNNILGISFCLQGIERFSLGTYKIGAILLVGLFFYDIFWVFGTDVMVTVAKKLDGPIKILFPRGSLVPNIGTGKLELSLLGLGDIVIPGFFLSLLLRFDAHNAQTPSASSTSDQNMIHAHFAKPYFHTGLLAYIAGLGTTLLVMIQFNAAQPALLYLVPACLGSSFLCAVVRGEVKQLLAYSEEEEEEEEEEGEDAKGDEKKTAEAKKDE